MPGTYNWPAAFTAFCAGTPLDEIAHVFGIEPATLDSHIRNERWAKLRDSIPQAMVHAEDRPSLELVKLEKMAKNREKNLAVWIELREHLLETVAKLRKGELKIERLFHNRGTIVRDETEPTTGDLVNIANYAKTIADGTYRALGDFQAQDKVAQDNTVSGTAAAAPAITIILPGVISAPREQRGVTEVKSEVIDLRPQIEGQQVAGEAPQP